MKSFYNKVVGFLTPIWYLVFAMRCTGAENIPEGGAIVCANHSHFTDPIFAAVAVGRKNWMHFMGKAELFKNPILKWVFERLGAFAVNRGENDLTAIKTTMKYLKNGEKVFIFPEGTRVDADDAVAAKTGAVRLAGKLNVPIVPVYIPRKKKLFRRNDIVIGKPYYVGKVTHDNADALSAELMQQIAALKPEVK